VSHSKERGEKICLNCNAELNGRFCHVCGQENLEPKESVWELVSHFFYDITHFDGKFFSTVGYLVRKPGFLSKEYLRGRRASYLNPIRMYVFSSALFFIIFYSMFRVSDWDFDSLDNRKYADSSRIKLDSAKEASLRSATNKEDSVKILEGFKMMEKIPITKVLEMDSTDDPETLVNLSFSNEKYKTQKQYDSIQNSLPAHKKDGWLKRKVTYRSLEINKKYQNKTSQLFKDVIDRFLHTFPYLLFVSLPLYAIFLNLLYIRRKQFYYVDHGIFLVHLYIFTFLVLLVFFAFVRLKDVFDWGWIFYVQAALVVYGIVYTLKAMRHFYNQRWGRTIVKFILLNFLAFISLIILFSLFFILTVFRV